MPVILDRLPLPNLTWYSGISIFCLLCSVYYAGVQVKINPDWKEQLALRQSALTKVQGDDTYPHTGDLPLHWGVFNPNDQDDEGVCFPCDKENQESSNKFLLDYQLGTLCFKETFEDIMKSVLYDEMCYLRHNSEDIAFTNYLSFNYQRILQGKPIFSPEEYVRRCLQAARKLGLKYNKPKLPGAITFKIGKNHDNVSSSTSSNKSFMMHTHEESTETKRVANQCDTFYDSYERSGDVSQYPLPLHDHTCDDREREMSPYLIPEIISFMFHEPLCIWTLINMAYCVLILLGTTIQHMVFGELRVSEQQHIKDKFWNFVFYKFIFVFGVMNVKHMDEAVLWCSWFSVLGFLHLLAQLCKDRFEYLSFSGHTGRRTHLRLLGLLSIILLLASACLVISGIVGCHAGINTFAFMAAECVLLMVRTLYVITRYSIYLWDISHQGLWEKRGGYVYVTELVFELSELCIDMAHHIHMLVWGNIMLTMASLVICLQLRFLFYQLQHKVKTHRNYLRVRKLLARYPEVKPSAKASEGEEDTTCVICWEVVAVGRQLPCHHIFHTDCLLAWLPQHLSCPTCRRKLRPEQQHFESGSRGMLARLFSRRSSDPLEGSQGGDSTSSSSEHSTPHRAGREDLESPVTASIVSRGLSLQRSSTQESQLLGYQREAGHALVSSEATEERVQDLASRGKALLRHRQSSLGDDSEDLDRGSESFLLENDGLFWSGENDAHGPHGGAGREEGGGSSGGGADGFRYVSWLSSFSVEQRHTQLLPAHAGVTTAPDSSVHTMALQVQQMFPHSNYWDIVEDLRRTRSIAATVDNILDEKLPPATRLSSEPHLTSVPPVVRSAGGGRSEAATAGAPVQSASESSLLTSVFAEAEPDVRRAHCSDSELPMLDETCTASGCQVFPKPNRSSGFLGMNQFENHVELMNRSATSDMLHSCDESSADDNFDEFYLSDFEYLSPSNYQAKYSLRKNHVSCERASHSKGIFDSKGVTGNCSAKICHHINKSDFSEPPNVSDSSVESDCLHCSESDSSSTDSQFSSNESTSRQVADGGRFSGVRRRQHKLSSRDRY